MNYLNKAKVSLFSGEILRGDRIVNTKFKVIKFQINLSNCYFLSLRLEWMLMFVVKHFVKMLVYLKNKVLHLENVFEIIIMFICK